MPLKKGKANVGYNIREESKAHPSMPQKQKVAIALHAAGVPPKPKRAKGNK